MPQAENRSYSEFSERTDRLAGALGINVSELPQKIGVGDSVFFGGRTGKVPVSRKTWLKLERLERATFGEQAEVREESAGSYGTQPTREICEAYFRARLDEAEAMRDKGGFTILHSELVKHIPPDWLDHLINLPAVDIGDAAAEQPAQKESRSRRQG